VDVGISPQSLANIFTPNLENFLYIKKHNITVIFCREKVDRITGIDGMQLGVVRKKAK
jgi:hypothetical protein